MTIFITGFTGAYEGGVSFQDFFNNFEGSEVKFVTKIWHSNVSFEGGSPGRVCVFPN